MHAIEKILARAAGQDSVSTGQIVNCRVDLVIYSPLTFCIPSANLKQHSY